MQKEWFDASLLVQPGVYLLWWKGVCVYVGQSKTPLRRIGDHHKTIMFDGVSFIPCKAGELLWLEAEIIDQFKPKLNGAKRPILTGRKRKVSVTLPKFAPMRDRFDPVVVNGDPNVIMVNGVRLLLRKPEVKMERRL